jgi:hypothetical protein
MVKLSRLFFRWLGFDIIAVVFLKCIMKERLKEESKV